MPEPARARSRPPIVMIVFDELPTTSLLGAGGRIDAVRYPNFAALARDATWFRNATSAADSTSVLLPTIIDGRRHRYRRGQAWVAKTNLFSLLRRRGYRVRASVEARGICPRRFCPPVRDTRDFLLQGRRRRMEEFALGIRRSRRPTIYFKHTLLPHIPWIYLPSGAQYQRGRFRPLPAISTELGAHDRYLVRLVYQRHLLQMGAVDRLLGAVLLRLRQTGLYDRAVIVVTADHGVSFRLGQKDRRQVTRANMQDVAAVPLLVKRPRQRRGRISRAYARTGDLLPTIADVVGMRLPPAVRGRSAFSRAVRRRRGVRVATRRRGVVVRMSGARFRAQRRRAVAYLHSVFGIGRRGPGLFAIGPRRGLRGVPTLRIRVAQRGPVRARLVAPWEFRRVDPSSRFVPAMVMGRIYGGRRGARRDLAVAVNGRIVATGRSFYLRGRPAESFAVLIPERALVPGQNRVEVLSVSGRGRRQRFRLLAVA